MSRLHRRLAPLALALAVAAGAASGCAPPTTDLPAAGGTPTAGDAIPGAPDRPTGRTADATLVRVVDGDTIRVRVGGVEEPVRYVGIDTPEPDPGPAATPEPNAEAATDANARLLAAGGRLVLERDVSDRDRFGRLLRHVWIEDGGSWTLVSLTLVAGGFAHAGTYPPDVKYADAIFAAQRAAREAGRGLWAIP